VGLHLAYDAWSERLTYGCMHVCPLRLMIPSLRLPLPNKFLAEDYYFVACVILIAFEFDIVCVNVFGPSATQQEAITFPV